MEPKPDPYAEDESRTLCYNWHKLAEAIVARACLDYEMLWHPESGHAYLWKWHRRKMDAVQLADWIAMETSRIDAAFENGLGDLAKTVGKYHLIEKVRYQWADDELIRKLADSKKLRIGKR